MLKISPGQFIEVIAVHGYDMQSQPEVQFTIQGNWEMHQMRADLITMTARLDALVLAQEKEAEIRAKNPALQELYNQYKVVLALVKETTK